MMSEERRWFLTPCGLDCVNCSIRLRTDEELNYWRSRNVDTDKIRCDGCRADRSGHHWAPQCRILQCCVYDKKLEFCAECPEFPCPSLEEWGREHDHHARAVERLKEMKKAGIEQWVGQYLIKNR
jgi:hypothetical protein